jgi:hypothetical protein
MLLLSYELGFLPPKQITNYNVSKRKTQTDQLAPATLEQLRAMNTLDDQLYRYALTLFDQKLEAMRRHLNSLFPALAGNPEEQLTLYHQQRRNDIEPRLKVANPPKPAEPIRYTFDQILAGSGWHPRERWEDQVVRWTGPGDAATLQFQLPTPCPYHVKVTVLDAVNQTARRQLRLLVNQVEVPLQFETDGDAWYYRGTVPQDALKDIPSGQEIRLQVPAAQLSEKSSHDSRLAGVCIASLEFFPVIPLQGRDEPLIIHFEDEMFGQNWYAVEYFRESGNRWTGPGKTATMHVGLHRGQNYQLKLDVLDFATEEARNSFHIRVNGVDVPLQAAETEVGFDYTGEILQTTLLPDSDAQWFEFIVDQTTPIRAADGSIERVLGVRLTSMTLTPVKAEVRNDSPLHILRGVLKTIQAKRASQ